MTGKSTTADELLAAETAFAPPAGDRTQLRPSTDGAGEPAHPRPMTHKKSYPRTQEFLLGLQIVGDAVFCFLGLTIGFFARFHSPLRELGVEARNPDYVGYLPLLGLGTLFFLIAFAYLRVYDSRLLLRPQRATSILIRGVFFWFVIFLSISLVLKFEPSISRIFVATGCVTTLGVLILWRHAFYRWLSGSRFRERMTQRVLLVGWTPQAAELAEAIAKDSNHPYEVSGVLTERLDANLASHRHLGAVDDLEPVLARHLIDIVVVADVDLPRDQLLTIASTCERTYTDFKVVPSFFQIFVSSLRMQTVSGVPILGVEELPIRQIPSTVIKRATDIIGGLVGLTISLPIMAVLMWIVYRESPGPVIYRQIRTGRFGRPFTIYKLRSMRPDAEVAGAQWAKEADPRRLKIGAFMREWNLDELPQFWNVLKGDMSLVGPRPERPELIAQFERDIPHYNPRHEVRPGLTGWAQVNGLRGNTSLVDRIKYDLYYIENWSWWFDLQIMILTFFKRQNAY